MKRKDKKLIRNLAREHYSDGKSMQETFDLISAKVKQPITEIADVIRFYPSPSLYEKHKKKIFLLFYSIMATELLILIAAIIASIYGAGVYNIGKHLFFSGYGVFFHKGYNIFLGAYIFIVGESANFGNSIDNLSNGNGPAVFGSSFLLIIFIVLHILPIVVWSLAISDIIFGFFKKKLEYIKMIIPYYWYTLIIYSITSFIISYINVMDYINSSDADYNPPSGYSVFLIVFGLIVALLLPHFLILRLAIKVRNNVTPKYKKVRVAIPGTSSKKKTRLGIVFNEESPSN